MHTKVHDGGRDKHKYPQTSIGEAVPSPPTELIPIANAPSSALPPDTSLSRDRTLHPHLCALSRSTSKFPTPLEYLHQRRDAFGTGGPGDGRTAGETSPDVEGRIAAPIASMGGALASSRPGTRSKRIDNVRARERELGPRPSPPAEAANGKVKTRKRADFWLPRRWGREREISQDLTFVFGPPRRPGFPPEPGPEGSDKHGQIVRVETVRVGPPIMRIYGELIRSAGGNLNKIWLIHCIMKHYLLVFIANNPIYWGKFLLFLRRINVIRPILLKTFPTTCFIAYLKIWLLFHTIT